MILVVENIQKEDTTNPNSLITHIVKDDHLVQ